MKSSYRKIALFLGLGLVVVCLVVVLAGGISYGYETYVKATSTPYPTYTPMPTYTPYPTATPIPESQSLDEMYAKLVNKAILATPIREDCVFEDVEHNQMIPSLPQKPVAQMAVFRRWFTADHEPCGFVMLYRYDDEEDTYSMWQSVIPIGMLSPTVSDDFHGSDQLADAREVICDENCKATIIQASQQTLIMVQAIAPTDDEAKNLCASYLDTFVDNLIKLLSAPPEARS